MKATHVLTAAALLAAIGCGVACRHFHMRMELAEQRLEQAQADAARWKAAAETARQGAAALEAQAQSCLDREAEARADADVWKELLEAATLREMDSTEHKGVPDNATRNALTDALDSPL